MNLVSFSVYGPAPRYWHGALRNAVIAAESWPGWTCRFYCDRHNRTTEALEKMGNVELVYRNDQRPGVPMLWRFAPAFDPALKHSDAILFRDADSRLSRREWQAVNEWILSQCDYHIIKDHPQHATPLLRGGLWGIRGEVFRLLGGFWDFLELWLTKRSLKPRHLDEEFLNEIVASALTTVRFHFPSALREFDSDTTAFIGQSLDEHDHPLN
jgi:hypothetical protein